LSFKKRKSILFIFELRGKRKKKEENETMLNFLKCCYAMFASLLICIHTLRTLARSSLFDPSRKKEEEEKSVLFCATRSISKRRRREGRALITTTTTTATKITTKRELKQRQRFFLYLLFKLADEI
jgi:hypothetical protein